MKERSSPRRQVKRRQNQEKGADPNKRNGEDRRSENDRRDT